ncbi:hypothetical protein [Streptomyces ortus]|uniref:Uncharacterized protein n=1 Tax=Streptomyces ortus TaxID=2867268 RepID=A0ABT3UZS4_9ACTN|nr:hypothetical protein [Streptomyces ortus]MCX4233259.1 hypothetical protein [Streptomyces ortus]
MESQRWRNLGVEVRRPTPATVVVALAMFYLLHLQPDVPEAVAVCVALVVLDCIRMRRASATVQALELPPHRADPPKRHPRAR